MKKVLLFVLAIFAYVGLIYSQCSNPNAGEDYNNCGVSAHLYVVDATTGYWEAFIGGVVYTSVVYSPDNTAQSVDVTIPGFDEHTLEVTFVWNDDSGPCTDDVIVTFVEPPVANIPGEDTIGVCGTTVSLEADTTGYGWASTGSWFYEGVPGFFSDLNDPLTEFSFNDLEFGDSAYVSAKFKWVMNYLGCMSIDSVLVNFYQFPDVNAGTDNAVCSNEMNISADILLEENNNYTPTWNWTINIKPVPEASAEIIPIYETMSEIIVSHYGIWEMILTESNSHSPECFDKDTVMFEFVEIPEVNAGEDVDVCGNCVSLLATPSYYNGTWLQNGCSYDFIGEPVTNVCCNTYGYKEFVWMGINQSMISFLSCVVVDTVVVGMWKNPTPEILNDPADSIHCGSSFEHLIAETPGSLITGYWTTENENAEIVNVSNTSAIVNVSSYDKYDFYWVEESGPESHPNLCSDIAGPLSLYFIDRPEAFAGLDDYFYGNSYQLQGSVLSEPYPYFSYRYTWYEDFEVDFSDYTSLNTEVSVFDYGLYEFVLSVGYEGVTGCYGIDTIAINFRDPIYSNTENNLEGKARVFPNPASETITISSTKEIQSVEIYDVNGRLVLSQKDLSSKIDISNLDTGLYFVEIMIDDKQIIEKLIKQ